MKKNRRAYIVLVLISMLFSFYASTLTLFPPQKQTYTTMHLNQQTSYSVTSNSFINISFDEDSVDYSRETHIENIQTPPGFELIRFSAFAHYTTHKDILLDFHLEFNTSIWNNNFALFNNSMLVQGYREQYWAVRQLTPVAISLLDVGP
ncbi:MAG: hypothetical protein ACTSW4_03555 [Candidatus Ranarchaeia archaeon]